MFDFAIDLALHPPVGPMATPLWEQTEAPASRFMGTHYPFINLSNNE